MPPLSKELNPDDDPLIESKSNEIPRVRHRSSSGGKSTYFGQYISFEGSKNLFHYKYKGSDQSLIFKHVLTPMNNSLLEIIPLWLAPNLITLIGLLMVLLSHAIFIYYCPYLEGDAPTWTFVFAAICLFLYQTLDNLDGKQARRTGSSSPLGLLFDHGCDALNVTVGCCTMASVTQLGSGWKSVVLFMAGNVAFTFATWEEYYTGALDLPVINGPTEGILIGITLKLVTAFLGTGFWTQVAYFGLQYNDILLLFATTSCIFTVATNFYNVYKAVRQHNDNYFVAITRLIPFMVLNTLGAIWIAKSPSDIMKMHPRIMLWTLGMLNSKLVLHLMLAHLCGEEYHPFRKTLVPIFYVAMHVTYSWFLGVYPTINEFLVLREFFFISLVSYVHIAVSAVIEVKNVLGVQIFTIPYATDDKKVQ